MNCDPVAATGGEPSPLPSDAELLLAVRSGDQSAYAELWTRHHSAALRYARQFVAMNAAEDLVSEAFARLLRILQDGGGPDMNVRPYLFTTIRRIRIDVATRYERRVNLTADEADLEDRGEYATSADESALESLQATTVWKAYATLPERWQTVLWYTLIDERPPAEVAPILGSTPNAVAALSMRAREGLRQAFLQVSVREAADDDCHKILQRLGARERGALSAREATSVNDHLAACVACEAAALEIGDLNRSMRGIVLPVLLGGAWFAEKFLHSASMHTAATGLAATATGATAAAGSTTATGAASASLLTKAGIGVKSLAARVAAVPNGLVTAAAPAALVTTAAVVAGVVIGTVIATSERAGRTTAEGPLLSATTQVQPTSQPATTAPNSASTSPPSPNKPSTPPAPVGVTTTQPARPSDLTDATDTDLPRQDPQPLPKSPAPASASASASASAAPPQPTKQPASTAPTGSPTMTAPVSPPPPSTPQPPSPTTWTKSIAADGGSPSRPGLVSFSVPAGWSLRVTPNSRTDSCASIGRVAVCTLASNPSTTGHVFTVKAESTTPKVGDTLLISYHGPNPRWDRLEPLG
jgi:RNA polymerase sigma factor (sigma-70 family)